MMKIITKDKSFKGQVLVLVALMMFAIIAMVALILDGGDIMVNRRAAQAAADAGALAGAQRACYGYGDAAAVAESYATNNGATSVEVPLITESQVTVVATVENPSFFANIFGVGTLSASAEATAGCYGLLGKGAVPIAFHCESGSIGGGLPNPDMYDCIMLGLDWNSQLKPLKNGQTIIIDGTPYHMDGTNIVDNEGLPPIDRMYIIMDTDKLCISDGGTVQCDLNDPPDGKDELKFGGNRSFLYLDGVNSITNFILKGPKTEITIRSHRWLSGDAGVIASVYNQMVNVGYIGSEVLVPVYNYVCEGDPSVNPLTNPCMIAAHADPWPDYPDESAPDRGDDFSGLRGGKNNYHILDFAPFYISCISTKGECPGYEYAYSLFPDDLDEKATIIEGFFITGYKDVSPDSTSTCDINLGNCIISLSD